MAITRVRNDDEFESLNPSQAIVAVGGNITQFTSGGTDYTCHTFTTSGSFIVSAGTGRVEYLVVGGGGAGAFPYGGGGGAGGLVTGFLNVAPGTYTVTVGAGGTTAASSVRGGRGGDSVFGPVVAVGGGGGGANGYAMAGDGGGSGLSK